MIMISLRHLSGVNKWDKGFDLAAIFEICLLIDGFLFPYG